MTTAIERPIYRLRDSRTLDVYENERIKPTDDGRYGLRERREPLRDDAIEEAARRVVGSIDAGEPYERTEIVLADLREALGRVDAERRHDARIRLARSLRDLALVALRPEATETAQRLPCAINSFDHHFTHCRNNGRISLEGVPGLFCRRHDEDVAKAVGRARFDELVAKLGIAIYGYDWPGMIDWIDGGLVLARAGGIFDALGDAVQLAGAAGVDVAAIVAPYEVEWGELLHARLGEKLAGLVVG
jgi:hypothetical protein